MKDEILNYNDYKSTILKYEFAKKKIETELEIILGQYENKTGYAMVEHIKSRIKSYESCINKLKRRGYSVDNKNLEEHVHDVIGVRIVCSFLSDVYEIVDIIKNSKRFKIKEESDYIKSPKSSGYVSYHMNVMVPLYWDDETIYVEAEIQIRTIAMDFWASLDHKLRYKLVSDIPSDLEEEMLTCSDDIRLLDVTMQNLYESVKNIRTKQNK